MPQLIEHLAELTGFRDRDQLDATIVRAIRDVLPPACVGLYRCFGEPGSQRWLTRARIGPGDPAAVAAQPGVDLTALPLLDDCPSRRDCLLLGEVLALGEAPQLTLFPISNGQQVMGVLEVETAGALAPADRSLVVTVLRIYGNFHDLLDYSERDPLTGLLNRQTFEAAFLDRLPSPPGAGAAPQDQDRRAHAAESQVWLGVVDIDHFKRVNDNFGHLIGDEVLLLVSRLLRANFRFRDRLYRFGGEEFVVVMECHTAEQAAFAFERLRRSVERFAFPQVGQITVSIGFARTGCGDAPSAAFSRADQALYHAKDAGRNQVINFDDGVRSGQFVQTSFAGEIELF